MKFKAVTQRALLAAVKYKYRSKHKPHNNRYTNITVWA